VVCEAKHKLLSGYRDREIRNYKLYGVVRNPYARMVSWWLWSNKHETYRSRFVDFLDNLSSYQRESYKSYFNAKVGKIDNFLHCESLEEDFKSFCSQVGLPEITLPHVNKTKHKHFKEYYDSRTRKIVNKLYIKDIKYFKYRFGE
jgi:hypothetical protein